jgi:alcohol dehydrogenase class IV
LAAAFKGVGKKIPFIALPTTSGTGSEATKNAVISRVGENGFKSSLRHDNFVLDIAIVDSSLALTCPPETTAACGMDALTQLLESLVSTQSSPMTDSLALGALRILGDSLITTATKQVHDIDARTKISYASYISGSTSCKKIVSNIGGKALIFDAAKKTR